MRVRIAHWRIFYYCSSKALRLKIICFFIRLTDRLAIDDNFEAELRRVEGESLDRYLKSLRAEAASAAADIAAEEAKGEK